MKMDLKISFRFLIVFFVPLLFSGCGAGDSNSAYQDLKLEGDWKMQSSEKLNGIGDQEISVAAFDVESWLDAEVPGTVLGSLVTNGMVQDPYFGINMQKVDASQFSKPWWFRRTFTLDKGALEKVVSLRFDGINYRADLWVNGKMVASKDDFAGAFRMFTFNISQYVKEGINTVALKLYQHIDGEYSIGFVDWNPLPPDKNMGIFRPVSLEINDGVKIRSPFVYSKVDSVSLASADLFIDADVVNQTDQVMEGTLRVNYELGVVEKEIALKPNETLSCHFDPKEFKSLSVNNVKLWWPNGMGDPNLYDLKVEFIADNKVLDCVQKNYGIREIKSYLNEDKNRTFEINGKFVLIKGGGWVDDLLLQDTPKSVEAQLRYIKHMNLNSIRCEGFWGKDETLYNLCDEYGILVMVGWSCQWEWEEYLHKPTDEKYGGATTEEDIDLLAQSWKDQLLWLRNHPSIYVWMLGSDKLPDPRLENKYVDLFQKYDLSRPYVTSAGGAGTEENKIVAEVPLVSDISGPTGMKMLGPYAYTPPVYWYTDTQLGGAYGFNTETCPGPSVPPLSSLERMFPKDKLWPIDKDYWEFHTGRNQFKTLDRYRKALDARYGESESVEEFAFKSQVSNYEVMRPMFEAFIAHKPKSTGVIQWMLNSAWPELYWQLYDTYLQPNGSFYGTRKACTPLHAIYRYGFNDVYLANEDLKDATELTVKIRGFDLQSREIFADRWQGDIQTNTSKFIYKLPKIEGENPVWFLALNVYDSDGKELDNSFYWLSEKEDVLDYEAAKKLDWPYYTPTSQYADFRSLNDLPKVKLQYHSDYKADDQFAQVKLTVKNPSDKLAFFVYFDIVGADSGAPVLPVYWDDNYISLLPGEERTYSAKYFLADSDGKEPKIKAKGWNVDSVIINE
ncbi:glycoside hydrolase family 2 protein [Mangrovibacterium diazotrophicum]|uniref:Exo-1,4-beta-D-glucosaminidase n=1 Tax=Mangrovibacterium diazotrophicum TaxID=1261403 RepID=A0A419W4K6_9BACT|nr:sugar-binding domain-containing protein [Mangrovibacterium diazotrophicum]RKD90372.1 exo-1,4-beta-D-glucosaminidase [Mangrovibacterium diazotrophicum]